MPVEPPQQQADPSDSEATASQAAADTADKKPATPAIALVRGEPFTQLPLDLYIPPMRSKSFLKPLRDHWICCSI